MDQVVNVSIADVRAQSLGAYTVQAQGATYTNNTINSSGDGTLTGLLSGSLSGAANFRLDSGDHVTINGKTVYSGSNRLVDAATLARNINNHPDLKAIGIEAKAVNTSTASAYNNPVTATGAGTATKTATIDLNFYIGDGTKTFTINNFATVSGTSGPATVTTMSLDELVSKINSAAATAVAPITAINDGGRLKLLTNNGETIAIEARVNVGGTFGDGNSLTVNINYSQLLEGAGTASQTFTSTGINYTAAVKVGRVAIAANEAFNFTYLGVSDNGDPLLDQGFNFDIAPGASTPFSNLYSIDLSTNAGAERALMIVSKALQRVETLRSQIGATMNNLQSIFDAQKVAYDNTKQAESVIRNTDYAEEMSNFTTLQIKMQSTIAMLAQANTLPQLVLQLLR
jgi:flagellin